MLLMDLDAQTQNQIPSISSVNFPPHYFSVLFCCSFGVESPVLNNPVGHDANLCLWPTAELQQSQQYVLLTLPVCQDILRLKPVNG